ncbi:MAG: hypothetical protein ACKOLA_16110 [Spartobacteria bacterium]
MPSDLSPVWLLKKHGSGNVHGPVSFEKLLEWAAAAQINPQDWISEDEENWKKAPMVEALEMDWLIEVPGNPIYGPTCSGAVLEFLNMGEIDLSTMVVNCCTGESMTVEEAPFYRQELSAEMLILRINQLEEEQRANQETIAALEARIAELEGEPA